ncbi:MAG: class I SAM-dependent methyltransferase [Nitrospinae bacterium]|nr:class I SAM-dependent methyltransferase [Nitrospinota bacterium]
MLPCRICNSHSSLYYKNIRSFYRCPECSLIFTNETVSSEEQEKHYKGQWKGDNQEFWEGQATALSHVIHKNHEPKKILDFGAGTGDLTKELIKRGYDVTPVEPMVNGYLKDQKFDALFNTVVSLEVIEHLPNMWQELSEIEKVLTQDGIMAFSTLLTNNFIDLPDSVAHFEKWWYKDDLTHVSFFCNKALFKIASLSNYNVEIYGNQLFVLRR